MESRLAAIESRLAAIEDQDNSAAASLDSSLDHSLVAGGETRPAKRSRSSPSARPLNDVAAATGGVEQPQQQEDSRWSDVLQRCSKAVVVIRCARVRAFDACDARFGHATGFVVDRRRGLILTNRHVVTDGPVTADAIFLSKEEVPLTPFYRDPVHDFAFFRFNPHKVQHLELEEIALNPDGARVGTDVRVVGNDAGEKLSILSGTIARLDRAAPNYGLRNYNDFNTFYLGAASNTSGGSSGSPVLAIDGRAIGLNAGAANKAASSYYLPVDRIVVALTALQSAIGERLPPIHLRPTDAVPRGCIQTIFKHLPFDECRRLGLSAEAERGARAALPKGSNGLLVVEQLIRGSPAEGKLQPGDILLRIGDTFCAGFILLEDTLDAAQAAGLNVTLHIERGGESMVVESGVVSLHSLTRSVLVEASGAVFHQLTLQQARHYNIPVQGVYIAHAGYMLSMAGIVAHSLVCSIGGEPVSDLDAVRRALESIADGERSTVRYRVLGQHQQEQLRSFTMDRRWYPMVRYTCDDVHGVGSWSCETCADPPSPPPPKQSKISFPDLPQSTNSRNAAKVAPCLCKVKFEIPFQVDGVHCVTFEGMGLVVDGAKGLVLVDRNTVPIALGDCTVTIAAAVEVPATLLFLHPIHNFAVVQFDAQSIAVDDGSGTEDGATTGSLPSARLSDTVLRPGDEVEFIGLSARRTGSIVCQTTCLTEVRAFEATEMPTIPRFCAVNEDVFCFDELHLDSLGGVFVDRSGAVVALWSSYSFPADRQQQTAEEFFGLPSRTVMPVVSALCEGRHLPKIYSLDVELSVLGLHAARSAMGLSDARVQAALMAANNVGSDGRRQVLTVVRYSTCSETKLEDNDEEKLDSTLISTVGGVASSSSSAMLQEGDVLIEVCGKLVTRFDDVEAAVEELVAKQHHAGTQEGMPGTVDVTVLRDKHEVNVQVPLRMALCQGTTRMVVLGGMVCQHHHREKISISLIGIIVSFCIYSRFDHLPRVFPL
eukprot:COSAG02_NODE_622_length_19435_cov_3.242398_15_plen_997_part_00